VTIESSLQKDFEAEMKWSRGWAPFFSKSHSDVSGGRSTLKGFTLWYAAHQFHFCQSCWGVQSNDMQAT